MMEYISATEASEKWGISLRQVQRLLANNRIPRAKKYGRSWMIPDDAKKPIDPRRERKLPCQSLLSELSYVIASTTIPVPVNNPDAILDTIDEERLRLQYEGELAYLRGDFTRTMRCFFKTEGNDAARLRACPSAIAAAISLGDYRAYTEIDAYLKSCVKANKGSGIAVYAELALATAAVSVIAPDMAPDWLKEGDFSGLAAQARQNALYLRAKYFNCMGRFEAMLAVAQTALTLSASEQGITPHDIYLRVMCAVACHSLERDDEAMRWLLEAMRIALPHGFITPFAEVVTAFGGLVEQCLEQAFPDSYDAVIGQWKCTWKNWITFHNQFTKDNITLMLSLREYHLALLVAQRVPYAKIAKQHCISVGRLKNIMLEIYDKLIISSRDELVKYVF
jgi:DNA-binding CsgD family transcriptional regulator